MSLTSYKCTGSGYISIIRDNCTHSCQLPFSQCWMYMFRLHVFDLEQMYLCRLHISDQGQMFRPSLIRDKCSSSTLNQGQVYMFRSLIIYQGQMYLFSANYIIHQGQISGDMEKWPKLLSSTFQKQKMDFLVNKFCLKKKYNCVHLGHWILLLYNFVIEFYEHKKIWVFSWLRSFSDCKLNHQNLT